MVLFVFESRVMIMPIQHLPNTGRTPSAREHTDFDCGIDSLKRDICITESQLAAQSLANNWIVVFDLKPAKRPESKSKASIELLHTLQYAANPVLSAVHQPSCPA